MKWISTKDKLPEPRTQGLAYAKEFMSDNYEIIMFYYYDRFEMKGRKPNHAFYEDCHCSGYDFDEMRIDELTHWMPLPNPPTDN